MGCRQNISMFMQPVEISDENQKLSIDKENEKKSFRDNHYELSGWYAFPINYFEYEYKTTSLRLEFDSKESEEIYISKINFLIESLDYAHTYYEGIDFSVTSVPEYNYYSIRIKDCLSDFFHEENDLLKLSDKNLVKVIIEVSKDNEIKQLEFTFAPVVKKSLRIIDNMMSI